MDDPKNPNPFDESEGVRILGAQPASDAAAPRSDEGGSRAAPRPMTTPSWDDEDDEEWGDDWDGDGVAPRATNDAPGAVDGAEAEVWDTDESGVWGDDETGAVAAGRAPAANASSA